MEMSFLSGPNAKRRRIDQADVTKIKEATLPCGVSAQRELIAACARVEDLLSESEHVSADDFPAVAKTLERFLKQDSVPALRMAAASLVEQLAEGCPEERCMLVREGVVQVG